MSLLEKALTKIEESKNIGNNIKEEAFISKSNFVGMKNKSNTPTTDITEDNTIEICPTCNKRYQITQDKFKNKDTVIDWFIKYLTENEQNFTLDWLKGQKLTFESVNEMRKQYLVEDEIYLHSAIPIFVP